MTKQLLILFLCLSTIALAKPKTTGTLQITQNEGTKPVTRKVKIRDARATIEGRHDKRITVFLYKQPCKAGNSANYDAVLAMGFKGEPSASSLRTVRTDVPSARLYVQGLPVRAKQIKNLKITDKFVSFTLSAKEDKTYPHNQRVRKSWRLRVVAPITKR